MRRALMIALAVSAAGCVVGPRYKPPQTSVDPTFTQANAGGYAVGEPVGPFWTVFADARLAKLIDEALTANHDVRIAAARLREARALRRESKFDRWPTTAVSGGYTRAKVSEGQAPGLDEDARTTGLYDVGFDAGWELDLFGRVRRAVDARTAAAEAAAFDARAVQVSVSAEIARSYFELRSFQRQLDVARQNAENQRQTLDITQVRLDAGRGTALDTERARAQLSSTLATIPSLEAAIAASAHRIAVLTGRQPAALVADLTQAADVPTLPATVDVGSPETLLRRRPDIQSAERILAAQTALVGVAVADLFPKVTFSARLGVNGETPADAFGSGGAAYAFGPSITWPAFNLGRVRARIRASEARADETLARYEQTVLLAIEEVETSLVAFERARARREQLIEAAQASERAADLARVRFEGGLSDFLQVLDAERTRLAAQDLVARSLAETSTSLVAVYKALGGGWSQEKIDALTTTSRIAATPAAASTPATSKP